MTTNIANNILACVPAANRQTVKTVAAHGTPERLTSFTVSSITRVLGVVTVTAAAAHNLQAGDVVVHAGADQAQYNGTFTIDTVPSATTYTFVITIDPTAVATPVTPATGTLTAYAKLPWRKVIFMGQKTWRTNNANNVYLGVTSAVNTQPVTVQPGGEYVLDAADGARLDLSDYWLDSAADADGLVVWWH